MCELYGVSSNKVVGVSFTWRGFVKRGRVHRDGWGVAWYLDNGLAGVVKEPRPAPDSPIARLMTQGVRSKIVISHVRWASRGDVSYVNTHPFVRRIWSRDSYGLPDGLRRALLDLLDIVLRQQSKL